MKRRNFKRRRTSFLIVLGFSMILASCYSKTYHIEDEIALTTNVDFFFVDWHQAAAEANYQAYFDKMDSLSVFIGTDYTENWEKSEFETFSKPYFDKGKAWSFKAIERNIYMNETKDFIWFDELLQTWMGICRGSGVIQVKDQKLRLKHYVLSVTVPNDRVNQFLKLKPNELDSAFVKTLDKKSIPVIQE